MIEIPLTDPRTAWEKDSSLTICLIYYRLALPGKSTPEGTLFRYFVSDAFCCAARFCTALFRPSLFWLSHLVFWSGVSSGCICFPLPAMSSVPIRLPGPALSSVRTRFPSPAYRPRIRLLVLAMCPHVPGFLLRPYRPHTSGFLLRRIVHTHPASWSGRIARAHPVSWAGVSSARIHLPSPAYRPHTSGFLLRRIACTHPAS